MEKDYWLLVFRDRVKFVLMKQMFCLFIVLIDLQTYAYDF